MLDDEQFPDRELVALLLSKIYFFLNDYDEALSYALRAGSHFDINSTSHSDFTEILINKAIEKYIKGCQEKEQEPEHAEYKKIVDVAIENSLAKGDIKSPLGISLDTQDLSLFTRVSELISVHRVIENVLPHLLTIEINFRKKMLDVITRRLSFPGDCTTILI